MAQLGVNVDHVATLRQARKTAYPDPVTAAAVCELAGAHQITAHLREDRRHIQDRDILRLRDSVQTRLNLEMAATTEMIKNALNFKPDCVTLVPEWREELTTEGGLEVALQKDSLKKAVGGLKDADIRVVLFIDPDLDQVKAAHLVDADGVEFHTGKFANLFENKSPKNDRIIEDELRRLEQAVRMAEKLGLRVAAGHGLHAGNLPLVHRVAGIEEYNIGHAIIARSIFLGLDAAVKEILAIIQP